MFSSFNLRFSVFLPPLVIFTGLLCGLIAPAHLGAQKNYKALWLPPSLHNIQDKGLWQSNYRELTSIAGTRGEVDGTPWMVVADREGIVVYDSPRGQEQEKLKFKEGPFYVIDQKEDWVEIVKGRPEGKEGTNRIAGAYVGWVKKANMLLWSEGLRSPSGIYQYVFILLRAEDLKRIDELGSNKAAIYNTPDPTAEPYDNIQIFSFYNVLKRVGSRYLIATLDDGKLPGIEAQISDAIIGWVDINNTTSWNTRVVLEPNFSDEGYADRKENVNYQLVGYDEASQAGLHARTGIRQDLGVKWEKDPVGIRPVELAEKDPRRFLGGVMRFPMLSRGASSSKSPTFKSGVIGDIKLQDEGKANDGEIAAVCNVLERTADNLNNVNILFAVQGTSNVAPYKEQIIAAAASIGEAYAGTDTQLRYGGVVYHNVTDAPAESPEKLVDLHPLSTDRQSFLSFLKNAEFDNKESDVNTNVPAVAYGIERLMRKVNLNQDHSNLLILVGSDGDFQSNRLLKEKYAGHAAVVSADRLVETLAAARAQLFSVAISVKGRSGKKFIDLAHFLTSSSSVSVYNSSYARLPQDYVELVGRPKVPYLERVPDVIEEDTELLITDSPTPGGIILPKDGTAIQDLEGILRRIGQGNKDYIDENYRLYSDFCVRGKAFGIAEAESYDNISAGGFTALVQQKLSQILQKVDISVDQLGDRFQLYEEVHFPRQIIGTRKPTMSYVLFMGDVEVLKYIQDVEEIINVASRQSSDLQREAVVDIYASLYGFFTGETDREVLYDKSIQEITSLMFGMEQEGLACPEEATYYCTLQLKEVLDENVISDPDVEKILTHFKDVADRLENDVLAADNEFRFKSRTGKNYYWVPLVDIY